MKEKDADNNPNQTQPILSLGESMNDQRPIKILVVDDESFVQEVITEFLADKGYDVSAVSSGEEAVEIFKTESSDVVLVDYKMEGMDGLTTIEKLTEISPSTVAVFMTGFPTLDSSIQALRLGAADYILKPFKLDEVALAVQKAEREWRLKGELRRLRDRVSQLEGSISEKKDNIKINKKLGVIAGPGGYAAKFLDLPKKNPSD